MTPSRRFSRPMGDTGRALSAALLVGHDTHPASEAAVRFAGDLALRMGAHLHVVHVIELADNAVDPDSPDWNEAEEQALATLLTSARGLLSQTDMDWTYHAGDGDPVDLLATIALEQEVLFIVVGETGHNLYRRLTEGGSVSRKLLREHSKPVLVVPEPHITR